MIDLQKQISVEKLNMYFETFRGRGPQRGPQLFSIWASSTGSDVTGDPKTKGWQYVGAYGVGSRGFGGSGSSYIFDNNLKCRYLLFITRRGLAWNRLYKTT